MFSVDGTSVEVGTKVEEECSKALKMGSGRESEYASLVLGQVEQMLVKQGEFVTKGQLLCKVSSSKMDLQI